MQIKRLLAIVLLLFVSASCFGQKLLFKTGFETNTTLDPVPNTTYSTSQSIWLGFHGTDSNAGFSWPLQPWKSGYTGVRVDSAANTSGSYSNYFNDYIDTTGSNSHGGSNSLHLEIRNYSTGLCCPQQPVGLASVSEPIRSFYERFWIKFPSSMQTQVQNFNAYIWDALIYFKTHSDYRSEPVIWTDPSHNFALHANLISDSGGQNATCPYYDPITFAIKTGCSTSYTYANIDNTEYTIPTGKWFQVEYYIKRSPNPDGRIFYAIDGHVVGDYTGITMGPYSEDIIDFGFLQQYSGGLFPEVRWIDDWEIWDAPPCTTLPCGTTTGSGGGTSFTPPPSPLSYTGAVGAVGVPFSYQVKATNNPTSYSIGALPPGLSLNTSTGLISGTPTTAGTTGPTRIQIYNASGKAAQQITFQINSSVQKPTIPYFWTSSSTVNAGQSTKLNWITLGAGTLNVSISPNVGTVTSPNGAVTVTPTSTTTYTLTATNSAGSTSKTVTVNVNGAVATAPNPPTALTGTVK